MKQFAILGYPLGHTLSPQLHRLLAPELGEQIDYQICQIAPEQLEQRLPELFALDGFNITIPYKVRIIDSLDRLDRTARNHGAVNVVGFSAAGERVGYNTDCVGFVRTMQTHGVEIKGDVCVLGAGGVGVHIQLPPGCRSRRAGYSAYLDAATGRDGPAVSLRGVQRPAARDSRGHYNGYILRLQSHCGKPAAVLV